MTCLSIIDFLSSLCIIIGIFGCVRTKKAWLIYILGGSGFIYLAIVKQLWFFLLMNIILILIAVKNYKHKGDSK